MAIAASHICRQRRLLRDAGTHKSGALIRTRSRHSPPLFLLIVCVITLVLSLHSVRNQAWFALSAAALCAQILGSLRPRPPDLSPVVLKLRGVSFAMLAVSLVVQTATVDARHFERAAPGSAVDAAASYAAIHPESKILADEASSALLLWRYPETQRARRLRRATRAVHQR